MRHRERVSALALLSANGPGSQHDKQPMPYAVARAVWGSDRLMWMIRHHFPARLTQLMGVPRDRVLSAVDHAVVDAELDGIFPVSSRVTGALFDAFVSNPDINNHDFRSISAPTLIMHAGDDALAPCWGAVALSQTIPGARLLLLEDGGGHLMLGEHPEIEAAITKLLLSIPD
jgi:pimeloyl-ACP methyl ester carboxylesterase